MQLYEDAFVALSPLLHERVVLPSVCEVKKRYPTTRKKNGGRVSVLLGGGGRRLVRGLWLSWNGTARSLEVSGARSTTDVPGLSGSVPNPPPNKGLASTGGPPHMLRRYHVGELDWDDTSVSIPMVWC